MGEKRRPFVVTTKKLHSGYIGRHSLLEKKKMNIKNSSAMAFTVLLIGYMLVFSNCVKAQNVGRPSPNLSEMEKWYNISNLTYDKYGTIKMDIVAKTNPPQTHRIFVFRYFDKNGTEVASYNIMGVGYSTPKGQVEHVESYGIGNDKINTIQGIAVYLLNEDGTYSGPAKQQVNHLPTSTGVPAIIKPAAEANNNHSTQGCSFSKLPALQSGAPYSEALVQSALYERYSFETNTGGLSSPLAVGVTFNSIRLLGSYKNTVTIVPGRGAQRKNDIAPVDATIYRFHAQYIVCRKYNNTTRKTQYESDNVIFKASNGNWQSFTDGTAKTQEL
jgi:hypothetical protein